MSTCRVTLGGIYWRFTDAEVDTLLKAEDLALGAAPVLSAAVAKWVVEPAAKSIAEVVIWGIAATIAIHKAEFISADKDHNGVEVNLPGWAIALGWFGALFMRPLTVAEGEETKALTQGLTGNGLDSSRPLFFYQSGGLRVACAMNIQRDLHICTIDAQGGLWHTLRRADGSWPFAFGDVQAQTTMLGPSIGPTPYVACATNPQGDLHICALDAQKGLWHTIRRADGSWPFAFGDVQAQTTMLGPSIGPTPYVACATNPQGDLHICAIDGQGGLWHTIRRADGSWPQAFCDVQGQTTMMGPSIGPTPYVACTTNAQGDLHVCAIDGQGGLWHTIRRADGSWPQAFGNVQAATGMAGPNIGPTPYSACATNAQGDLHICAIDGQGGLWHTIRRADGSWPQAFGNVQAQTRLVGPSIGPTPYVACATNDQGDLHICATDAQAGLWRTIRRADGIWPSAFEDIRAAVGGLP